MATKIITVHYTSNGTPQPGLSPTIDIFLLSASNTSTNTHVVTAGSAIEIGMGWYRYDFTSYDPSKSYVFSFDGGSSLAACDRYKFGGNESYVEDIVPAVWDEPATSHTQTSSTGMLLNQIQANTATILINETAMATLLNTLLKYERNRTRIDTAAAQMIIYDDDGVTPLTVFDLIDFNGMPSVQEVCERMPQ